MARVIQSPPQPIPSSTLRALAGLAQGAQQALRRCEIERAMELLGIMRVMLALYGATEE